MMAGADRCSRRAQLSLRIQLEAIFSPWLGCCSWDFGWVLRRLWPPVVEEIPSHL